MKTRLKYALSVIFVLLITGCGQRGPLFLPEPAPAPNNQPAESPSSTPPDEQGAE